MTRKPSGTAAGTGPRTLIAVQEGIAACERCSRLRRYCARVAAEKKRAYREEAYWGRPVPGFGDEAARLLIVGLAPAAHGANRTGRVFTGDSSGDFLFRALHRAGFANIPTSTRRDDGLQVRDAYVSAAVRCAPPDNKPTPAEIARCLPWLAAEIDCLPRLAVIVALGRIGFDAVLRVLAGRGLAARPRPAFGHGVIHRLPPPSPILIASYHPSRQNTNTGRLTEEMFDAVFATAAGELARLPGSGR